MSIEEAGCPKNSNRRTRVVGAPKLSWQKITKNTKHPKHSIQCQVECHVMSSTSNMWDIWGHLKENLQARNLNAMQADRHGIHMITNPRRRAIRQLQNLQQLWFQSPSLRSGFKFYCGARRSLQLGLLWCLLQLLQLVLLLCSLCYFWKLGYFCAFCLFCSLGYFCTHCNFCNLPYLFKLGSFCTSCNFCSLGYSCTSCIPLQLLQLLQLSTCATSVTWATFVPPATSATWATFVPVVTSATCKTSADWANFVPLATLQLVLLFCNFLFQLLELGLLLYLLNLVLLMQLVLLLQVGRFLYLLNLLQFVLLQPHRLFLYFLQPSSTCANFASCANTLPLATFATCATSAT